MALELNYDEMILLDAEDLAEIGIKKAYQSMLPKLRQYVSLPADVEELSDRETTLYAVQLAKEQVSAERVFREGSAGFLGQLSEALVRVPHHINIPAIK